MKYISLLALPARVFAKVGVLSLAELVRLAEEVDIRQARVSN